MRIFRKATMRLGDGTVVERRKPVTIAELTDDERLVVNDWIARHGGVPGSLNELTMLKFLDVDNTVYFGEDGSKVALARKMWLREVLRETWDDRE